MNTRTHTLHRHLFAAAAALLLTAVAPAQAQVTVKEAWIRGTVAQQKATGLFAHITAAQAGRLVAGSSPVAGLVEIHEMTMDGTTMRMRAIPALDLPAGKAVELKPGGLHLMLLDLKRPLKAGEKVPVSLVVETGGQRQTVELQAEVRAIGATQGSGHGSHGAGHGGHDHKH